MAFLAWLHVHENFSHNSMILNFLMFSRVLESSVESSFIVGNETHYKLPLPSHFTPHRPPTVYTGDIKFHRADILPNNTICPEGKLSAVQSNQSDAARQCFTSIAKRITVQFWSPFTPSSGEQQTTTKDRPESIEFAPHSAPAMP